LAVHVAADNNPEALELSPLDQTQRASFVSSFGGGTSSALHFPNPRFDSSLTLVDSASESPSHHFDHPKPPSNLNPPVDPAPRAKSDLYNFFTDYIESYQDDDFEKSELSAIAEKEHEAAMASYSNNYGPPTASPFNPARQEQQYPRQQQQPAEYNQQAQYPYDDPRNNQQGHFPPYRQNTSPDRHPGSRQNNSPDRHPDYRQQSPPRQYNDQYQRQQDYSVASGNQYGQPVGPGGYGARGFNDQQQGNGRMPYRDVSAERGGDPRGQYAGPNHQPQSSSHDSYGSEDRLATSGAPPAMSYGAHGPPAGPFGGGYGPGYDRSASPSALQPPNHPYRNPYDNHSISRNNLNGLDYVDPNAVIDDGDDGLEYHNPKRRSMISLNRRSMGSNTALAAPAAAALPGGAAGPDLSRAGPGAQTLQDITAEKSSPPFKPFVPDDEETKSRKWKKILFIFIAFLILLAIAGGVVGGLIANHKLGGGSASSSAAQSGGPAGVDGPDMNINSPSVKKLLNNPNLHKVFMGMAYTPMNTQYPNCMSLAPIQNNVTLDLAVLSQVTNVIRLYGTDCNQTEMVLHAIDRLQPIDMKVWIGVWLNNNETTNTRQVNQLWSILDNYGTKYVKGIIVGNEVLYRQDLTLAQLTTYITGVRANLTSRGFNLPVASADLGDNWTSALADVVDVVMSNVHPFFGGVSASQAAGWTYTFWTGHDVILTQGTTKQNVISEVGWPSQGGTDCAPTLPPCPDLTAGAVSGIPQMNTFLGDWVCQTMKNQTQYFWYVAQTSRRTKLT
jgi:exo-beta-1,3-glucanase (GH17 family)